MKKATNTNATTKKVEKIQTSNFNDLMIINKYHDKFNNTTRDVLYFSDSKVIKANYQMILDKLTKDTQDVETTINDFNFKEYSELIDKVKKGDETSEKNKILTLHNEITKHLDKSIYFVNLCKNKHLVNFNTRNNQQEKYYNEVDNFDKLYNNKYTLLNNKFKAKILDLENRAKKDETRKEYYNNKIKTLKAELKNELLHLDNSKENERRNVIKKLESFEYHTRKNLAWYNEALNIARINARNSIEKAYKKKEKVLKLAKAI